MKWFSRLKEGLSRSTGRVKEQLVDVFTKSKLEAEDLEKIEETLILTDLGPKAAAQIANAMGKKRFEKGIDEQSLMRALADEMATLLQDVAKPLTLKPGILNTLLVVGVNGSGKTTTIAKLASQFHAQNKKVVLAAGDTFRAAAVEQLQIWGNRAGVEVVAAKQGGDAAGLVFDALTRAQNADVLLVDTAGRLHNKHNLMQELEKIVRVMGKKNPGAPHHVLLVLDGTSGQNALEQVRVFTETVPVTGLVVTKLDGTSRAGIVVALAERFRLPIHAIGVGEGSEDLQEFTAEDFAKALVGVEE